MNRQNKFSNLAENMIYINSPQKTNVNGNININGNGYIQ
jgi:hypothetical protein